MQRLFFTARGVETALQRLWRLHRLARRASQFSGALGPRPHICSLRTPAALAPVFPTLMQASSASCRGVARRSPARPHLDTARPERARPFAPVFLFVRR